ncbi:MAG: hypothetical protein IKN28_08215, partial [Firmicutes bacterium]|nr:hypothetical protein [Bacillota bacterium]
ACRFLYDLSLFILHGISPFLLSNTDLRGTPPPSFTTDFGNRRRIFGVAEKIFFIFVIHFTHEEEKEELPCPAPRF